MTINALQLNTSTPVVGLGTQTFMLWLRLAYTQWLLTSLFLM